MCIPRGSGTSGAVYLVAYGSNGNSGELRLENNKDNFSRGRVDSFLLEMPLDLGQLQRLRIGHDGKGSCPRWHLHHVTVTRKGEEDMPVTFPCGA